MAAECAEEKMNGAKEGLADIKNAIAMTQMSTSYKFCLLYRRLKAQVFCGGLGEKKDFLRWITAKVFRIQHHAKPLCDFDVLEYTKKICDQLEMQMTDHASAMVRKDTQQIWIFDDYSYSAQMGKSILAEMAKSWNDMGFDVQYVFCREGHQPLCEEPVSRRYHLEKTKMRDVVSHISAGAVFVFLDSRIDFQPYFTFAKQHELQVILLEDFIHETECLVDCALFEPGLRYVKPTDINLKAIHRKIILVEGLEEDGFDPDLLKSTAKILDGKYDFYVLGCKPKTDFGLCANIYFIGYKAIKDLPGYYACTDGFFWPVRGRGSFEMSRAVCRQIAMGKKAVICLEQDLEIPNVVWCEDAEEIAAALKGECGQQKDVEQGTTELFAVSNSYYRLCGKLLTRQQVAVRHPDISVIILNRNNKEVIFRCIDTLIRFNTYDYEIIVVDNDSKDGSYEMLKDRYKLYEKVEILKNHKNGCSSGRNLGVLQAKGDYLFFLDSDQWIIGDHWMDIALKIMHEHIGIGAVAWNAGWFYPGKLSALIVDYLPDRGIRPDMLYRTDIGLLATSGFLMRKDVFEAVGGFDEFYDPTCFEDTDLTLKIRSYGYEVAYTPYMLMKHLPHQTTKSGSAWHKKLMKRNEQYCKEKWEKIDASLFEYYY